MRIGTTPPRILPTPTRALRRAAALACVCTLLASAAAAQTFSFAGFSWDQSDSPDIGAVLAPGSIGGAVLTAQPSTTANVTGFPTDGTGFDGALTPGRLLGFTNTGNRAVNLPSGNDGTLARSGFQLSWSSGRRMQNQPGDDFVFYESASSATAPEAFMVQVRRAATATWSRWYYRPALAHQLYTGDAVQGAFVTAYDLDDFGVGQFEEIDAVRVANLTDEDRIDPPGTEVSPGLFTGEGFVRPEDTGTTSDVLPDPGPLAGFLMYGASTYDPDILYLGALVPPNICGDGVTRGPEQCDDGNTIDLDGCSATCRFEAAQTRPQSNCLKTLNTAGIRIAAVQANIGRACAIAAARGESNDAQGCLTADTAGRMLKARNKTARAFARACRVAPLFGETDVETINDAAQNESLGLIADIYGTQLDTAVIAETDDLHAAKCQAALSKAWETLAATKRRVFLGCKRAGLDGGTIVSSAGLESCLDVLQTDPQGKILLARNRMLAVIQSNCSGVDLSDAFPGSCAAAVSFADCLDQRVDCRVCRGFNGMDRLTRDCDAFDDGTRNGSCP